MKSLWIILLIIAAYMLVGKYLHPIILVVIGVGIIAALLYSRRAVLLTQMASQAYFVKGDEDKAFSRYQSAYKTGLMTSACKVSFAAFCLYTDRFERSRRLLNETVNSARSSEADVANAKHYLAILEWKEGNLDDALILMEEVHKDYPSTGTYGSLGAFYLEKAKRDDCYSDYVEFMLEAYDYNESDKTIADNLGELYLHMEEYKKAKEVYEKLLSSSQLSPVPYYNYAIVLKNLGDKDGAKENLEKALNCNFTRSLTVSREIVEDELNKLN